MMFDDNYIEANFDDLLMMILYWTHLQGGRKILVFKILRPSAGSGAKVWRLLRFS